MNFFRHIYISLKIIGYHSWKNAINESFYLKHPHRHVFTIKVYAKIIHNNRDIEFHVLQRQTYNFLTLIYPEASKQGALPEFNLGNDSCENLCEKLFEKFNSLGIPVYRIECSEDGENGAILEQVL